MKMRKTVIFITSLLVVLVALSNCICYDTSLMESVRDVYSRLVDAERRGADVREAALKLNRALQLIKESEIIPENKSLFLSEARMLVEDVNLSIPLLIQEAESKMFWRNVMICSVGILIIVAGVITYHFGPSIFWEAWLKIRSKWIVEVVKGYKERGDKRG